MKKPIIIVLFCLACGLFSCTQTEPSTTTSELDSFEIIEQIHNNSGLSSSSEKLNEYIKHVNVNNVINVVENYKRSYGKSIFNEIMRNVFISSETRAEAAKHIKDMLMQAMKRSGTYTEDYDKLMDGHIDYEKNKFGRMKSKDIDEDLRALFDRHRQTRRGKSYNKLIPANGIIDATFNQGHVQDCWLLSAIKSLSINPKGLEMLNDLISIDDKGNVTVQLKGVNRAYTISKEELEGANEFAQGDLDIRAIELAVNKYLHEVGDHGGKRNDARINRYCSDIYDGNHLSTPYRILFDKPVVRGTRPNKETIEKIKSGNYSTVVLSNNDYQTPDCYFKRHIYAVTGADDNYAYLSDPLDPDTNHNMTHEDFVKFFNESYSMPY